LSYRDHLTDTERKLWDKATLLFTKLLDNFRSKNLLRKGTIQVDRGRLAQLWENSRNYGLVFNELVKKLESKEQAEDFAQKCQQVGLAQETIFYLFMAQMIGTYLVNLESVFRTSLIFFLEEEQGIKKDMTLGQLLKAIRGISPAEGKELESMVDTELRNCLAHGAFWFQKGAVFLAKNSYLEDIKEAPLHEFWIEFKKANIIAISFIETLIQKIEQGYFRL
jgi:hypothetical protein